MFVLLYGPPAAGKLTVANELAKLTDFKVFHNHLSIDLAETFFERGTPSFGRVVFEVRKLVLEEAVQSGVDLIVTYAYAHGVDDSEIAWMLGTVEAGGGRVQLVQLTCTPDALRQRVADPSRKAFTKIRKVKTLDELMTAYDLFTPYPDRLSLQLDTTDASPFETAAVIAAHLGHSYLHS